MKKIIMVAGLLLILGSCYNDKYDKLYPAPVSPVTCDTTTITYSHDIQPIINQYCAISGGCHDAAGAGTSGFDYQTSITALQTNARDGSLLTDINFTPTRGHNNMPKGGSAQLSACDINKITRWVHQGANP